jgi:Tol biopolymer transport system component
LRQVDLSVPSEGGFVRAIQPFAPATRTDSPGRFSPDGSKVAFVSNRNSLNPELWIANCDGGELRQITSLGTPSRMLAGSWSPDSQRVAFDAEIDGNVEVYVVSAEGGKPTRLTTGSSIDALPEWSKDGRWIYYASTGSGSLPNIWRIPAEGGKAEQLTTEGGFEPQQSPDGQSMYYVDRPPSSGSARLMKVALAGGNATVLVEGVTPLLWSPAKPGIYFLRAEQRVHAIYLYRFEDQKTVRIGALPFLVARLQTPGRFTVSRDGRWALMNVVDESHGDLMLLDNFR